jgi:GTPase SAR1 family protein
VSNTTTVQEQVEAIRQQAIHIFNELVQKTKQFDLSALPADVEGYQKKLATTTYNVLVVGEAKRGKSSFVNALIGRELLPTDVDIATNQVFCVSNAEHEAYRLRFEDGSVQNISADELLEYGSQTVMDRKGSLHFNLDQLQQIEVDMPVRFLPPEVSILDTPGLGSLYAAHAQVTQRFVPKADAVIFVLDSSQPIGQFDLNFLESILKITNHIFFIQTKIDLYDKAEWQQVQQRNEATLRDHFNGRLVDTHVWPISNRNLTKAGQTNNPAFLKVSRQPQLMDALEVFLFRVAGWSRCASALTVADHYYGTSRQVLAERLRVLEAKSTQELADRQETMTQRGQRIQNEWGAPGKKRRELLNKARSIISTNKQNLIDLLESGGTLEKTQRRKIDATTSIDEVNKLGMTISEEVVTEASSAWRTACEQARTQCSVLLGSVEESTDEILLLSDDPNLAVHFGEGFHERENLTAKLWEGQNDFILGVQFAFAAAPFAIVVFNVALPLVLVGIAVAGLLSAARGWGAVQEEQLQEAKQKLHDYLSDVMQQVRKQLLQPDARYAGKSLMNHYFDSLIEVMEERIEEIVNMKAEEARRESARLEEQVSMSKQERSIQAETFRRQLAEWDKIGNAINSATTQLKDLERSLGETASSTASTLPSL